jgi:uncharacterized membrane protein YphA (DoxX/SURF4 family)
MSTVSAVFLACVLGIAAASKTRDIKGTRSGFIDLGLPRPGLLAWAVPLAEALVALLMVLTPGWGGVAAFALLSGFTVVLVVTIRSGRIVPCRCFGGSSSEPVSWAQVARNAWLLSHAVVASLATSLERPNLLQLVAAGATIGVGPIAVWCVDRFTVRP